MDCEKLNLSKHLAVHEPDALRTQPWQEHVKECGECRLVWRGYATSLAVYEHVERQDASRLSTKPDWETFSRKLRAQQTEQRHVAALRGPWLAGVMGLALAGGVLSWGLGSDTRPAPSATIVIDEKALRESYVDAIPHRSRAFVLQEVRDSTPAKNYRPLAGDWRSFRRGRLLEQYTLPMGRPPGEMAILPFGHERQPIPFVMPVSNAPSSAWRSSRSSSAPNRIGYVLSAPVH